MPAQCQAPGWEPVAGDLAIVLLGPCSRWGGGGHGQTVYSHISVLVASGWPEFRPGQVPIKETPVLTAQPFAPEAPPASEPALPCEGGWKVQAPLDSPFQGVPLGKSGFEPPGGSGREPCD